MSGWTPGPIVEKANISLTPRERASLFPLFFFSDQSQEQLYRSIYIVYLAEVQISILPCRKVTHSQFYLNSMTFWDICICFRCWELDKKTDSSLNTVRLPLSCVTLVTLALRLEIEGKCFTVWLFLVSWLMEVTAPGQKLVQHVYLHKVTMCHFVLYS